MNVNATQTSQSGAGLKHFILQFDEDVCAIERSAVAHAAMLDDSVQASARATLSDLLAPSAGSRSRERDLCPVGSVEFCRAWMRAVGVPEPPPLDYPKCLEPALARVVRLCALSEVPIGDWIKPYKTKAWTPHRRTRNDTGDENVWRTPYIPEAQWQAEWRVYAVDGAIVGEGRYDDGEDEDVDFDHQAVSEWVRRMDVEDGCPSGFALDVALLNGKTVLVEATDGWAIGCYRGIDPRSYARLLWRRWRQMTQCATSPSFRAGKVSADGEVVHVAF